MTEPDPYEVHWARAWARYRLFFGLFLAWMPFGIAADALCREMAIRSTWPRDADFFGYFILVFYAGFRAMRVTCPRCERPFTRGVFWSNNFTRRCLHCGLPWGATLAEAEAGTAVVPRIEPLRVARLVLGTVEILCGLVLVLLGTASPSIGGLDGRALQIAGVGGFALPGFALILRPRWGGWLQLLPFSVVIVIVVAAMR